MAALLPGLSPTTTAVVFLDTLPAALPPRARMASLASSRLKPSSDPVTTTLNPSSVRGTEASRSSAIRTPAAFHRSTTWACQSTANQSTTASAMTVPTPSVAASSATAASRSVRARPSTTARTASMVAYRAARARAAVGPTCRIDSATSTRHRGCRRATSRVVSSRRPLAEVDPSALV